VYAGYSEYDIYAVFARQQINNCFTNFELIGGHVGLYLLLLALSEACVCEAADSGARFFE